MSTAGKSGAKSPPVALRRLSQVQPAQVELGRDGTPVRLDDRPVEQVRERWVVEEGWWTDAPVRRAYAELVLADGGLAVVFEDLVGRRLAPPHVSVHPASTWRATSTPPRVTVGRPIANGWGSEPRTPIRNAPPSDGLNVVDKTDAVIQELRCALEVMPT